MFRRGLLSFSFFTPNFLTHAFFCMFGWAGAGRAQGHAGFYFALLAVPVFAVHRVSLVPV